jgi:hypothetical protein
MTMHVTPEPKNMLKLNAMEVAGYLWVIGIIFTYILKYAALYIYTTALTIGFIAIDIPKRYYHYLAGSRHADDLGK